MVGVAIVNALIFQKITAHVAMVDAFPKKLEGEGMDYCHGLSLIESPRIDFDTDFCITSNSKVIVLAAGARQMKGESRLDLVQRNSEILKSIIPTLVGYSPNAVILVVSNPGLKRKRRFVGENVGTLGEFCGFSKTNSQLDSSRHFLARV